MQAPSRNDLAAARRLRTHPELTRAALRPDLRGMSRTRRPAPPKPCPVCRIAMQETRREAAIVHRCERCSLTITVKQPALRRGPAARPSSLQAEKEKPAGVQSEGEVAWGDEPRRLALPH